MVTSALLPVVVAIRVEPFCKLQLVASLILSMAILLSLVVFTVSNWLICPDMELPASIERVSLPSPPLTLPFTCESLVSTIVSSPAPVVISPLTVALFCSVMVLLPLFWLVFIPPFTVLLSTRTEFAELPSTVTLPFTTLLLVNEISVVPFSLKAPMSPVTVLLSSASESAFVPYIAMATSPKASRLMSLNGLYPLSFTASVSMFCAISLCEASTEALVSVILVSDLSLPA